MLHSINLLTKHSSFEKLSNFHAGEKVSKKIVPNSLYTVVSSRSQYCAVLPILLTHHKLLMCMISIKRFYTPNQTYSTRIKNSNIS